MRQSRLMSLVEAVANVAVGYGVAVRAAAGVSAIRPGDDARADPRDRRDLHVGLAGAELRAAADVRGNPRLTNDDGYV